MHIVEQHLQAGIAFEERQRLERYKRAWQRYGGDWPKPLRRKPDQPDFNLAVNWARTIVDTGASFLFGKGVSLTLDRNDGEQSEDEAWLAQVWSANRQQRLLMELAINGAVCGDLFVKLARPAPGTTHPRIIVLDPAIVHPIWDPHDIQRLQRVTIQYTGRRPNDGRLVTYRQRIEPDGEGWIIIDEEQLVGATGWVQTNLERWAWPICPVLHAQNLPQPNEFWGRPDLDDDVLRLNETLNFLLGNLNKIIFHHAHPKTIGKGVQATQIQVSVDGVICIPPTADLQNLEMQSDLSASLTYYQRIREALHEIAQLPEIATGKLDNVGQLSGLALQILYGPLLARTNVKRMLYGELLEDVCRGLLYMGNRNAEQPVRVVWPEPLPSDPAAEAQVLLLDRQLGASQDTLLRKRGYEPEHERQQRSNEQGSLGETLLRTFDRGDGAME